jgi:hypothetical protein
VEEAKPAAPKVPVVDAPHIETDAEKKLAEEVEKSKGMMEEMEK